MKGSIKLKTSSRTGIGRGVKRVGVAKITPIRAGGKRLPVGGLGPGVSTGGNSFGG